MILLVADDFDGPRARLAKLEELGLDIDTDLERDLGRCVVETAPDVARWRFHTCNARVSRARLHGPGFECRREPGDL
jgi:hypothetical protein